MAARPQDLTSSAIIRPYTVDAAVTVTKGKAVKFGTADNLIADAGANEKGFGIALEPGVAGSVVQVALLGYAIIPVLVGTGGATRGEHAVMAADGHTNQVLGGGNTVRYIEGTFLESGVVGDLVALLAGKFAAGSA